MKRILSLIVAALLLFCALPAIAEDEAVLKLGRYATDSAGLYDEARLYLYEDHVGVFNVQKGENVYSYGVTWAPNQLVIEHETVHFTVSGDRISFLYDGEIYSLSYAGMNLPTLGGEFRSGVYAGENGEMLYLAPDGKGLLKEGNTYTALYWASCTAFLTSSQVECFAVMDSFLAPLDFKTDAVTLYGDNNKNLVFKPEAVGQFDMMGTALESDTYQIYAQMPSAGWTVTDVNSGLTVSSENDLHIQYALFSMPWEAGVANTTTLDGMNDVFIQSGVSAIGLTYEADKAVRALYPVSGTTGRSAAYAGEYLGLAVNVDCISWTLNGRMYAVFCIIVGSTDYAADRMGLDQLLLTFSATKSQADRLYYGLVVTSDGQAIDLIDLYDGTDVDVRDFCLLLNADGTGYVQFGDPEHGSNITWTETTMTAEGETITYTMNGDHIVLTIEDESIELAPAAEVEALLAAKANETPAAPIDFKAEDVVGEWVLTSAVAYGLTMTPEQIGQSISLTLAADGTGTISSDGVSGSITWAVKDGMIEFHENSDVFYAAYDGVSLIFSISDVQLILTRK